MSQDKELTRIAIALRVLGVVAIVIGAAALGRLLGGLTAPDLLPPAASESPEGDTPPAETEGDVPAEPDVPRPDPPLFLHLGITPESQWDILDSEVAYAAGIGLHRYMIPALLPWTDADPSTGTLDAMKRIAKTDPEARFVLQLDFNPPAAWYDSHPDARMADTVGDVPFPSPSSEAWITEARAAFDRLAARLAEPEIDSRVSGFALYGLLGGGWQRGPTPDTSAANTAAFRAWLTRAYGDDKGLQEAWKVPAATLEGAEVPAASGEAPEPASFQSPDTDRAVLDYRRFSAESVADAIGALSAHIREARGDTVTLWANYGHVFEKGRSTDGHLALGTLLDSDVDGFLSPVSQLNRGIGATGGFMGPVDSAKAHGKTWVLVDDTRTGIAWSKESGQIEQMRGLRAEDVHNVQRRNFAMALVHGLDLVWSDPGGEGFLYDDEQWRVFEQLYSIYRQHAEEDVPPPPEETAIPGVMGPARHPTVQVLLDEESQFLTRPGSTLDMLLSANRDAILQSGVSAEFYLLDDLLDNKIESSPVYLFLNAYRLSAAEVAQLHARFAAEKATAIWVYAPGYLDVTMNRTNVRDTVGMEVRQFDEPAPGGSQYALGGGHWIDAGQAFGEARLLAPLFYVDDPEADILATYQQSEKASVAMRTMEEGWSSIFIAEPRFSAPLIRELLRILEQPVYSRPGKERYFDSTFINSHLVAIHADQAGERIVNLGQFYDIEDLFDASIGWPQKESFVLNFKKGETRLFHLTLP